LGAAGLLLTRRTPSGSRGDETAEVLLQHRAEWVHHGGTWSVPGGAIHSGETAWDAALREVVEETALDLFAAHEIARHVDDHGGWSYTTIVASIETPVDLAVVAVGEQQDLAWIDPDVVDGLPLHPGFGDSWPAVHDLVRRIQPGAVG
jgi:8-oxo-dGTP pyrophosphatase MutT (NUDIX family)